MMRRGEEESPMLEPPTAKIQQELFYASDEGKVRAVGVEVSTKPEEVHIFINGVDITETMDIVEIRIVRIPKE